MVLQQRKEALTFVIKSLPPSAWRHNSALTLICFTALFTVFRFNYWLVLLQKGNVLLYQLPGREFSENYHVLQKEVIIFHFPWKILVQDTFMHCHRFTGNIEFSAALKLSTRYPGGVLFISDILNNLSRYFYNLYTHKAMGTDGIHPRGLKELAEVLTKTLPIIYFMFEAWFLFLALLNACFPKKNFQLRKILHFAIWNVLF